MVLYAVPSTFAVAALSGWIVSRRPRSAAWLALWPVVVTGVLLSDLRSTLDTGPRVVELPWAPSLGLTLSFHLDGLGLLFALLITTVGALVVLYASRYLRDHRYQGRFHVALFAFMGAMLGVALSDNVLTLFVFWELTGFTSYFLIGFDHERKEARSAALQALIVTGAGGLALLAAGILLFQIAGTTSLQAMVSSRAALVAHPLYMWLVVLILAAAFTKSAQFPFHFWLPNAMTAPTPVSAFLHSATMVKAGVFLVARMTPILGGTEVWTTTIVIVGAVTMIVGAYRSVQEDDLKRILAYSTVSALGVLIMLLGVGTAAAVAAALVYLAAHACYKGALFLVAGGVEHETGSRSITALSGLRRSMPITAAAATIAAVSMAGVPLTLGFVAKDGAYAALIPGSAWTGWLLAATIFASVLLGLAALLAGVVPFRGAPSSTDASEPSPALWLPPLILAAAGALGGIAPWLLDRPLSAAAAAILNDPASAIHFAPWHGLSPAFLLSLLTLAGVAIVFAVRERLRARLWRPAQGAEWLYTATMATLGRISRAIAPALHSASLRAYIMAIVVTTAVVGGVALYTAPDLAASPPKTSIRLHEGLIALVMVAGAAAAAMARSTMAAVLAVGVVGYGVATTFLLFGAPDLAMTQFSVETLTVLIYVLVFRHFRNLGALSPRAVRYRDAVIAATIGTFVAALVLAVSTTETSPRLREYFAQFGPALAYGRNIVNVILVDFRAFDTLGEITVLATAAIGVWALVWIARSREGAQSPVAPFVTSPIFRTAVGLLMPLLLLFAVFLLLRGHNEPGGGFVGGLIAAAAFALYSMSHGVTRARRALLVTPLTLLGSGLLIAVASGLPAIVRGQPFLTAQWMSGAVTVGTPLFFDIGVFLVVAGVVLMMVFSLAEES